jgi:uncharacterized protein YdeI (YjbR/CyaY-like superfamily)
MPATTKASAKLSAKGPAFFATPAKFRAWLAKNHAQATELLVGFYKRDSGKPSITWPESVDEALCFGWIDGVRRSIDAESYSIRFSPRKATSVWSAVNIKRVAVLTEEGRMTSAGLAAFEKRRENRSGVYAYEQRSAELPEEYAKALAKNAAARKFFEAQPPSYRKTMMWWIVSAKREETRQTRLAKLIAECAAGRRML